MKTKITSKLLSLILLIFVGLTSISCKESPAKFNQEKQNTDNKTPLIDSLIVYQTDNLIIKRLSNHIYQHISFLNTDDFGKVSCNGMLVVNDNKGIIFDTTTDNTSSLELINFVKNELKSKITAIIPTHFHKDCVGGIQIFEKQNIPIYANNKTIKLLKKDGQSFSKPINSFENNLMLNIGNKKIYAVYFGEGHTTDNIIGYFPEDKAIFGGCLIKKVGSSKGNLEDANTNEWSKTVRQIKLEYPKTKIVVPGHGKSGSTELLDYTIELFEIK